MRKILRSMMWTNSTQKDDTANNYKVIQRDRLLNTSTSEGKAIDFILDFYQRNSEPPQAQALFDFFEAANDAEGLVLYEELILETPYFGGTFVDLFDIEVETQASEDFTRKAKLAIKIATTGAEITKGNTVKGVNEAVAYAFSELRPVPSTNKNAIPASMKKAGDQLGDLYEERKNAPHESYGVMTGYGLFDSAWHGLKRKQFTLLGGFGGHLKSTLMMNICLNGVVDGGWNHHVFTSEMPADDLKMMMIAIHSGHPQFGGVGRPLSASRLLLGALNQQEEDFFKLVKDDLTNNPTYGNLVIVDSADFSNSGSIMQRVTRDDADEEIDSLWVDYITRLPLDAKYRGMEITAARNETIADWKRFAMGFKGRGLAVSSPFQINREGYKKAKVNEGRMDKTAFGQYNAAEKEADNMAYIFYDQDEAATSEPKVGLAKARYGAMNYDPVNVFIEPDCRRIYDLTAGMNAGTGYAPTGGGDGIQDVTL